MLHAFNALLTPAILERLTLVLNHLLAAEPVASARLAAHSGRSVEVQLAGWPRALPRPLLAFDITPAGLLEWRGAGGTVSAADAASMATADLVLRVDAANPALVLARWAGGQPPAVEVQGDPALAADVDWLLTHLRWDAEADLARVLPPRVAHELMRAGSALAAGLRAAMRQGSRFADRWRPGTAS